MAQSVQRRNYGLETEEVCIDSGQGQKFWLYGPPKLMSMDNGDSGLQVTVARQTRQAVYYNVTLRYLRVTTAAAEKQNVLNVLSVCL